jgi:outer membrane receptor for ferrienterochelin and colicins
LLNKARNSPEIAVSRRIYTCIVLLFLFLGLINQTPAFTQNISLLLNDKITGYPVEFARVMIKSLNQSTEKSLLSNDKGEIETSVSLPVYVVISCLGYKSYTDTITTYGQFKYSLSPEYYQLDNVVVTGQYRPQTVDKSIYNIHVLENRQLKFKTASTVDELLKNELSFRYKNDGTLGISASIRGLTGEYIKVLMDGMPVTGRDNGFIDLSQISLYNVDHIEIVEGPMSMVYGSNALAGAINIITSDHSSYNILARINAHIESVGIYNFDGIFSKKFLNHTVSFNVARNFYSGWSPYDTSRYQIIKPKLQYIAGLFYQYAQNRLKIKYTGSYINEELHDLDSLSFDGKAIDNYYYTTRLNNILNLLNVYNNLALNLQAGYSYYQQKRTSYDNDLVVLSKTITQQDTVADNLFSFRGILSNLPGKKLEYQTGIESSYEYEYGKRLQGTREIADFAGFLSLIYRPYPLLSLQPGLRYIYNSKFHAPLVYAINLKLNPGSSVFRASYARGFNSPSLKQLYLLFKDTNHEIHGNENLKAETANNFSLSGDYTLTHLKQSLNLKVDLFYNSIYNAIQLAINPKSPGWGMYFNVPGNNYKTKGLETSLSYNFSPRLTVDAGAITTGFAQLENQSVYNYATDYTSSLIYRGLKYNYEIAVYYKYTGKSIIFAGNFNSDNQLIGVSQQSIEGYNSMDLILSKNLFKEKIILSGGVKNIFDVTMINTVGSVDPHGGIGGATATGYGRSFFIKITYQFEKF